MGKRLRVTVCLAILGIAVCAFLGCMYAFLFFAWLTATPLTPQQIARAQYDANVWLVLAGLSVAAGVIDLIVLFRPRKRGRGFPVSVKNGDKGDTPAF